jgi:membrane protease YdiL (CAAX protease family)
MTNGIKMKPMPFWTAILFFAVPSAVASFGIYVGMQYFHRAGVNDIVNLLLTMVLPLALMLFASLAAYRIEGNRFYRGAFSARFRLKRMKVSDWLLTAGLLVFMVVSYRLLSFTAQWLIRYPLFEPPEFLIPAVDPRVDLTGPMTEFLGVPLLGNWWIAFVYFFVALGFNIFGEEFWWRGYILPRQELALGRWTWVVHGVLWCLFHIFWKWNLLMLLPTCLAVSFVAQRTKNTWPGIIVHYIFNSLFLIPLVKGIAGM